MWADDMKGFPGMVFFCAIHPKPRALDRACQTNRGVILPIEPNQRGLMSPLGAYAQLRYLKGQQINYGLIRL
ncbi:MAG: hypothetical protein Pyrs2KO_03680 [Pyruvatibacter sp.]